MSARLDQLGLAFIAILVAAAIAVPLLSLAISPNSPFYLPPYLVQLLGKYLCYAILAVALDLVWGYCGILSLGHGAFFALGGYAMGMYLMRQIGTRGVYANPILPDFMVFSIGRSCPSPGGDSTGFLTRWRWWCWSPASWRSPSAGSHSARA